MMQKYKVLDKDLLTSIITTKARSKNTNTIEFMIDNQ